MKKIIPVDAFMSGDFSERLEDAVDRAVEECIAEGILVFVLY